MGAADRSLFRDVNRLAAHTGWLHGFMAACAGWLALTVLAGCVALAWWRGRARASAPTAVSSAAWAAVAGVVAYVVSQPVSDAIGRSRPWHAFPGALVLVGRPGSASLPGFLAALAGAVVAGLWLSDRRVGGAALVAAVVLAFAQVYVGVHYPADEVSGLLIGAVLAIGLRPAGMSLLRWVAIKVERSPLHLLVAAHRI